MVTTKTIYKCDICGTEVDNAGELATLKIPCRVFDSFLIARGEVPPLLFGMLICVPDA